MKGRSKKEDLSKVECALCHQVGEGKGSWGGGFLPPFRLKKEKRYVHKYCARFSPQVRVEDGKYTNIGKEVKRGAQLSCPHCKRRGATIGCLDPYCKRSYHLICAAEAGCGINVDKLVAGQGGLFCPDHLNEPDAIAAILARDASEWVQLVKAHDGEATEEDQPQERGRKEGGLRLVAPASATCRVCRSLAEAGGDESSDEEDEEEIDNRLGVTMLECHDCKLTVHAACYGISSQTTSILLNSLRKTWTCEACSAHRGSKGSKAVSCVLCHRADGAGSGMKVCHAFRKAQVKRLEGASTSSEVWVHSLCALWDEHAHPSAVNPASWLAVSPSLPRSEISEGASCQVCGDTGNGFLVQCAHKEGEGEENEPCGAFFHPTCALEKKYYLSFPSEEGQVPRMFCPAHTPAAVYCVCKQPFDERRFMIECDSCKDWFHGSCVGMEEPDEEEEDEIEFVCPACAKLHREGKAVPEELVKFNLEKEAMYQSSLATAIAASQNELEFAHALAHLLNWLAKSYRVQTSAMPSITIEDLKQLMDRCNDLVCPIVGYKEYVQTEHYHNLKSLLQEAEAWHENCKAVREKLQGSESQRKALRELDASEDRSLNVARQIYSIIPFREVLDNLRAVLGPLSSSYSSSSLKSLKLEGASSLEETLETVKWLADACHILLGSPPLDIELLEALISKCPRLPNDGSTLESSPLPPTSQGETELLLLARKLLLEVTEERVRPGRKWQVKAREMIPASVMQLYGRAGAFPTAKKGLTVEETQALAPEPLEEDEVGSLLQELKEHQLTSNEGRVLACLLSDYREWISKVGSALSDSTTVTAQTLLYLVKEKQSIPIESDREQVLACLLPLVQAKEALLSALKEGKQPENKIRKVMEIFQQQKATFELSARSISSLLPFLSERIGEKEYEALQGALLNLEQWKTWYNTFTAQNPDVLQKLPLPASTLHEVKNLLVGAEDLTVQIPEAEQLKEVVEANEWDDRTRQFLTGIRSFEAVMQRAERLKELRDKGYSFNTHSKVFKELTALASNAQNWVKECEELLRQQSEKKKNSLGWNALSSLFSRYYEMRVVMPGDAAMQLTALLEKVRVWRDQMRDVWRKLSEGIDIEPVEEDQSKREERQDRSKAMFYLGEVPLKRSNLIPELEALHASGQDLLLSPHILEPEMLLARLLRLLLKLETLCVTLDAEAKIDNITGGESFGGRSEIEEEKAKAIAKQWKAVEEMDDVLAGIYVVHKDIKRVSEHISLFEITDSDEDFATVLRALNHLDSATAAATEYGKQIPWRARLRLRFLSRPSLNQLLDLASSGAAAGCIPGSPRSRECPEAFSMALPAPQATDAERMAALATFVAHGLHCQQLLQASLASGGSRDQGIELVKRLKSLPFSMEEQIRAFKAAVELEKVLTKSEVLLKGDSVQLAELSRLWKTVKELDKENIFVLQAELKQIHRALSELHNKAEQWEKECRQCLALTSESKGGNKLVNIGTLRRLVIDPIVEKVTFPGYIDLRILSERVDQTLIAAQEQYNQGALVVGKVLRSLRGPLQPGDEQLLPSLGEHVSKLRTLCAELTDLHLESSELSRLMTFERMADWLVLHKDILRDLSEVKELGIETADVKRALTEAENVDFTLYPVIRAMLDLLRQNTKPMLEWEAEANRFLCAEEWRPNASSSGSTAIQGRLRAMLERKPSFALPSEYEAYLKNLLAFLREADKLPPVNMAGQQGGLCWVKFRGFPFWPARIVTRVPSRATVAMAFDESSRPPAARTHLAALFHFPTIGGKEVKEEKDGGSIGEKGKQELSLEYAQILSSQIRPWNMGKSPLAEGLEKVKRYSRALQEASSWMTKKAANKRPGGDLRAKGATLPSAEKKVKREEAKEVKAEEVRKRKSDVKPPRPFCDCGKKLEGSSRYCSLRCAGVAHFNRILRSQNINKPPQASLSTASSSLASKKTQGVVKAVAELDIAMVAAIKSILGKERGERLARSVHEQRSKKLKLEPARENGSQLKGTTSSSSASSSPSMATTGFTGISAGARVNSVRLSSRNMFQKALRTIEEGEQLGDRENKIDNLIIEIENSLYRQFPFGPLTDKVKEDYKARARSLAFNMTKNRELRALVLAGEMSPDKLTTLSPQELASKDLQEWRQQQRQSHLQQIVLAEIAPPPVLESPSEARSKENQNAMDQKEGEGRDGEEKQDSGAPGLPSIITETSSNTFSGGHEKGEGEKDQKVASPRSPREGEVLWEGDVVQEQPSRRLPCKFIYRKHTKGLSDMSVRLPSKLKIAGRLRANKLNIFLSELQRSSSRFVSVLGVFPSTLPSSGEESGITLPRFIEENEQLSSGAALVLGVPEDSHQLYLIAQKEGDNLADRLKLFEQDAYASLIKDRSAPLLLGILVSRRTPPSSS